MRDSAAFRFGFEDDLACPAGFVPGLNRCAPWPKGAHPRTARAVLGCTEEAVSKSATGVLGLIIYSSQFSSTVTQTDSRAAIPSRPPAYPIQCSSPMTVTNSPTWNLYIYGFNKFTIPGNQSLQSNDQQAKFFENISRRVVHSLPGIESSSPGPPAGLEEQIGPTPAPNSCPSLAATVCSTGYTSIRLREAPRDRTPRARDDQQASTMLSATYCPVEARRRAMTSSTSGASRARGGDLPVRAVA
jgi:hypothetical protein